jgi:hypothetical protein
MPVLAANSSFNPRVNCEEHIYRIHQYARQPPRLTSLIRHQSRPTSRQARPALPPPSFQSAPTPILPSPHESTHTHTPLTSLLDSYWHDGADWSGRGEVGWPPTAPRDEKPASQSAGASPQNGKRSPPQAAELTSEVQPIPGFSFFLPPLLRGLNLAYIRLCRSINRTQPRPPAGRAEERVGGRRKAEGGRWQGCRRLD